MRGVRLIPELDKIPWLIRAAQTPAGKVAIALIYGAILYAAKIHLWNVAPFIILLFSFEVAPRLRLVAILNVVFWFSFGTLYHYKVIGQHWNVIEVTYNGVPGLKDWPLFLFTHLPALVAMSLIWLMTKLYVHYGRRWPITPVLIGFTTLLMVPMVVLWDHKPSWLFFAAIMVVVAKCIWFVAYAWQDLMFFPRRKPVEYLPTIVPFFSQNFINVAPVPRGLKDFIQFGERTSEQAAKLQLNAIKLSLWALFCYFIGHLLRFFVTNDSPLPVFFYWQIPILNFPSPMYLGLKNFNVLDIPLYLRWAATLFQALPYILAEVVGEVGLMIAFIRLIGFHVPRQAYKPHKAIDFLDFFRRIYFYYNEILIQFFFYPLWRWSRRFRLPRQIQLALCIFATIYIGGLAISYFRNSSLLYLMGPVAAFEVSFRRSFYFAGLGIFAAYSALRRRALRAKGKSIQWRPWRSALAYSIYSVLYSLQGDVFMDSLWDRWIFLLKLFGLGG